MALGLLETFGLKAEGFTDEQITQLDAIRPDIEHIAAVLTAELPRINRIVPVIAMAIAVVNAQQKKITGT